MNLTWIDNIYKKWKDIKEYADSRIQFASLSIKNNIETLIQPAIDSLKKALDKKQDKLRAGKNITIRGNVISVTIDISGKQDKTVIVDLTSGSTATQSLDPNKLYMFGEKTDITITSLNTGEQGVVNEYMFQFTSGSAATTLNLPSSIKWLKVPDIQANKTYQVSIVNDLAIIGEWSNE